MSVDLLAQIGALKGPAAPQPGQGVQRPGSSVDFGNTLESLLDQHKVANNPTLSEEDSESITFSRHAKARLESRGLELDSDQLERLGEGLEQLSKRGAKESLVLMDDMAMIVGVPKKTVITAMSRNEAMGNIFTNIDSTLVVD